MASTPVFVRARLKTSASLGRWQYFEVYWDVWGDTVEQGLHEWCGEEFCRDYRDGEHFRGADYEVIERPPDEWLRDQIRHSQRALARHLSALKRYRALLGETR